MLLTGHVRCQKRTKTSKENVTGKTKVIQPKKQNADKLRKMQEVESLAGISLQCLIRHMNSCDLDKIEREIQQCRIRDATLKAQESIPAFLEDWKDFDLEVHYIQDGERPRLEIFGRKNDVTIFCITYCDTYKEYNRLGRPPFYGFVRRAKWRIYLRKTKTGSLYDVWRTNSDETENLNMSKECLEECDFILTQQMIDQVDNAVIKHERMLTLPILLLK
jgi:hypothetical protein